MKNILESFLDALEVRYTKRYVRRLYEEHPHRGNMYGLKQMLAVYGVRALGVYMEDKDLLNLSYPCIFHTGNDFDYRFGEQWEPDCILATGEEEDIHA